jgi:LmbE family N-acetylglucosaminyl deacetylase
MLAALSGAIRRSRLGWKQSAFARERSGPSDPAALVALLQRGDNVLVLTDARRAAAYRRRAPNATILTDASHLDRMERQFDAALVDGVLQELPWDRWALQRVHRTLRMDGTLVVVVPLLASFATAFDLPFMTYARRQLLRLLAHRWEAPFELRGPVRRRYRTSWLLRKLESVGFTAVETRGSSTWARKASSIAGVGGRAWPEAKTHREQHDRRYPLPAQAREAWLSSFPEFRGLTPRALDPARWRGANVLVLAPHPDDELIGSGGTLCRLVSMGANVSILHATDGAGLESLRDLPDPRRRTVRLDEARDVATALGAKVIIWGQEDSRLRCSDAMISKMARLLHEVCPALVLTPFLGDLHTDHATLSRILGAALPVAGVTPQVLQYEVWSLVPANFYCDVTLEMERLERLLFLYDRPMRVVDFVHFCGSRNLARALELTGRPGYMEAFLSTTSAEYRKLAGPHAAT